MAKVCLKGMLDTGHGTWPPRKNVQACEFFTVNGIPVVLQGHAWEIHQRPGNSPQPHAAVAAGGSPDFTINGVPVARMGDPISCGGTIAQGADNFDIP